MQWWLASLKNPDRTILVLENESGEGLGSLRKDKLPTGEIELSWMIAPEHRGKGLGSSMLLLGIHGTTGRFIARIKPENTASCRMVEKLGFSEIQPGLFVLNSCD
jgi:RimJ/RimL family protein N-acetyltransferase